ncbi:histidine phosphotransferase ChpT [Pseudoroseicyclus aestuarii]|uniref:Histidine phosphotransferase ChpT n=1 Tax=Pseudoroseicyclus aestuarii TaxID=1795041 RepID=A0A318SVX6_9RHOB|nr:histidine phosphotransferase ChpT [Pseudoroseicyclus aestuarii]
MKELADDTLDPVALACSRICHDLVNPLSAIAGGAELLGLQAGSSPELALVSESVAAAMARIRFFRIAFGAPGEGQSIASREIRTLLEELQRGSRIQYDWRSEAAHHRADLRAVFLLMQCCETAMTAGGTIKVENGDTWTIEVTAKRLNRDPALWDRLTAPPRPADGLPPSHVHFLLLPQVLSQLGRRLRIEANETALTARF